MDDIAVYINFTCNCKEQNESQRIRIPGNVEGAQIKYKITEEVACRHCRTQPRFIQPEVMIGDYPVKLPEQDLIDGLVDGLSKTIESQFDNN